MSFSVDNSVSYAAKNLPTTFWWRKNLSKCITSQFNNPQHSSTVVELCTGIHTSFRKCTVLLLYHASAHERPNCSSTVYFPGSVEDKSWCLIFHFHTWVTLCPRQLQHPLWDRSQKLPSISRAHGPCLSHSHCMSASNCLNISLFYLEWNELGLVWSNCNFVSHRLICYYFIYIYSIYSIYIYIYIYIYI